MPIDFSAAAHYEQGVRDIEFQKKLGVIKNAMGRPELDGAEKKALGQALKSVLRSLAKIEGWKTGEYEVRYNPGGSAVKGDGVLHGEDLYVSVSPDSAAPGILVRNCQGLKDYQGGANGWMGWQTFLGAPNPHILMNAIRQIAPKIAHPSPCGTTLGNTISARSAPSRDRRESSGEHI